MAIRIYTMYEINESPPLPIETNVLLLTVCSVSALCLLILIVLYRCQFSDSPPIVAIIAMLLLNDLLQLICDIPVYFSNLPTAICLVSITGTTFFRLATYYWLIFIARLIYREKVTPGKFIDLRAYVSKNIIFTYIPSIAVTLVVLIAANIDDNSTENNCWRAIKDKSATDYIIYLAAFVLPNLVALVILISHLVAYFRFKTKAKHSLCLAFPLIAIPFIMYDLTMRLMIFFQEWQIENVLDLPFLLHPICHGVVFAIVLHNLYKGQRPTNSDITIKQPSVGGDSFLVADEAG